MTTQPNYTETTQALHANLDHLQFGQSLSEARFLVVDLLPEALGALISRQILALQFGYILSRTVVFRQPERSGAAAFFEPFSSCAFRDISHWTAVPANFDVEQFDKVVYFDFDSFWANHRLRRYFFPWAPPEYRALKCPRLIFDGEFLSRFRLTDAAQNAINALTEKIDFSTPTIGLDARDDKVGDNEGIASIDDLLSSVESICQRYGVRQVLVAGDPEALGIKPPDNSAVEYIYIADKLENSISPGNNSLSSAAASAGFAQLAEYEMLSSCDWIVGRVQSDIARHAAARIGLRTFRCDRHRLITQTREPSGLYKLRQRT